MNFWIKYTQRKFYSSEIESLKIKDDYQYKSKIRSLQPILDQEGILRIGGRIDKACLPYSTRHPAIIPPTSRLGLLILKMAHDETLHGGPQAMIAYIRRHFWIASLRSQARMCVARCVKCARYNQKTAQQIMAELPEERLKPARPFQFTGVDLAGPFNVKITDKLILSTRSKADLPEIKGYISVFVCLVTRAVHLEPVMDMSAEAFLRALQRFWARRGLPEKMFSDHGTNFIGADNILQKAIDSWRDRRLQDCINYKGIEWEFITPNAPHEGGIWEAAVKSMKHHLRRIMGPQKYSYEGISTLISGIEACMNSRPICAMSDDPTDSLALTPAHFLIGGPIKLPINEEMESPPRTANRLFKEIQFQTQSFWNKWSQEYITSLINRPKWREEHKNIRKGQLALIKNDNLAPTYWLMGRIIETFKGEDGKIRSARLKTETGTLERSIRKLCILPVDEEIDFLKV